MRTIKFRGCEGFPKYEVGSDGSIWSLDYNNSGKRGILRQYKDKDGYPYVFFVVNRKRYKRIIHRLVLCAFVPKPSPKHQCNHKNGIRHDNRLENLEWLTHRENVIDGWERGRTVSKILREKASKRFSGTNNPKAKLDYDAVAKMRSLRKNGMSLKILSALFGVSRSQTSAICLGNWWHPELLEAK